MYADNTVMYFAASNTQEISSTLTSELAKVNDWLVHSSIFIHPGKTECILFGTGSRLANANLSVNIDGKELTKVAEYKYLGVILDESPRVRTIVKPTWVARGEGCRTVHKLFCS